jgi:hypothetical protein
MATYTWGETVVRRRHWEVPCAQPWGAAYVEVLKAIAAAEASYREHFCFRDDVPLHDDALRITVTDDEVVITYTIEEPVQ